MPMPAKGPPCPYCERRMTYRAAASLKAKKKRTSLGPNRQAALELVRDGYCAICNQLPIKTRGPATRGCTYTCGQKECQGRWGHLATLDKRGLKLAKDLSLRVP